MVLRQTRLLCDRAGLSEKSEQAVERLKDADKLRFVSIVAVVAIVDIIKVTIASQSEHQLQLYFSMGIV